MFFCLVFIIMCLLTKSVSGAHFESVGVPSERDQLLAPHTMDALASRANLDSGSNFRVSDGTDIITAKGVKQRRLTQTYGEYEVYGSVVTAELTMDGQYTGHLSGNVVLDLSSDIPDPEICQRKLDEVLSVAVEKEGYSLDDRRIQDKDGRRVAYIRSDNKASMAYVVNFFVDEAVSKPLYIIDACDDTVYATFNLIHNATTHRDILKRSSARVCGSCNPSVPGYGGNQKTGRTTYNTPPFCLKTSKSGSTCTMQSTYVKVVNNMGSESRNRNTAISFSCSQGYTDPYGNKNGGYGTANDAMYFGHVTGEFYVSKYSFRALSWTPKLVIHYGRNYENAFWTGTNMYFGDGQSTFHPLVSLDVTTHELAHGITSTNSNLEYRGESGGINEAFSDISGEVVEHYTRESNDWFVGADIFKSNGALRYFVNPPDDGRSIKHTRDYYNGMDVHYSSGVYNHAFYRMVNKYNMPIYDVYKCFLDANRNRWGTTTGFTSGACEVARACYSEGYDHASVRNAFSVVGISFTSCPMSLNSATIYSGRKRSNILVSATRKPIMEINLDKGRYVIEASTQDGSDVTLSLATDEDADDIIDEKLNKLVVNSDKDDNVVYVKVSSLNMSDLKVELDVKMDE